LLLLKFQPSYLSVESNTRVVQEPLVVQEAATVTTGVFYVTRNLHLIWQRILHLN